jgi:hypothetical protein
MKNNKEISRMKMLAGLITEGQYKKLITEEIQVDTNSLKQILDNIPNEKYFYIIDDNRKSLDTAGPEYIQSLSAFYRDMFDNELQDLPGLENFDSWYELTSDKNARPLLYRKVKNIIDDYIKQNNVPPQPEPKNPDVEEVPLTPEVKEYIDDIIEGAKQEGKKRFDYLKNVEFFQSDLLEMILVEFTYEFPNAGTISQEVIDYIDNQIN